MITNPKNDIWAEKYRPTKLDDLVLSDNTRSILEKFIRDKSIPDLLFIGSVGSGKTTIAKILLDELDCDKLEMNAGSERGIDIIRNKVITFAMMQTMKQWKIAFMDEFDSVTPEAQDALKRPMEIYSNQTRFILTCNSINRIIPAIRSRCQIIEFKSLNTKDILKLLQNILDNEKIKYNVDDLLLLIEDYSPKIRDMIGNIQLNSIDGVYKYVKMSSEFVELMDRIKTGDLTNIRKMNLDYAEAYKYLFDRIEELTTDYNNKIKMSLTVADHFRDEAFCADHEINFAAAMMRIMEILGVKVK